MRNSAKNNGKATARLSPMPPRIEALRVFPAFLVTEAVVPLPLSIVERPRNLGTVLLVGIVPGGIEFLQFALQPADPGGVGAGVSVQFLELHPLSGCLPSQGLPFTVVPVPYILDLCSLGLG